MSVNVLELASALEAYAQLDQVSTEVTRHTQVLFRSTNIFNRPLEVVHKVVSGVVLLLYTILYGILRLRICLYSRTTKELMTTESVTLITGSSSTKYSMSDFLQERRSHSSRQARYQSSLRRSTQMLIDSENSMKQQSAKLLYERKGSQLSTCSVHSCKKGKILDVST